MSVEEKFAAIRKGLLEFLILKIVAADKVYAADIVKRLSATDFATQEGTLYPLLSKMRARRVARLRVAGIRTPARPEVRRTHGERAVPAQRAERLLETSQRDHHAAGEVVMQKVISINLNGHAYQLDESGYETLSAYWRAPTARSPTIPTAPRSSRISNRRLPTSVRYISARTRASSARATSIGLSGDGPGGRRYRRWPTPPAPPRARSGRR